MVFRQDKEKDRKNDTTSMVKKKEKWGQIGAPGSKKRGEYLASIRKKKRNTKQQREAKAAETDKEDITLIESNSVNIEVEEEESPYTAPVQKSKAAADIEVKEQKKIESPGEPGEPYVVYPY